MIRQEIKLGCLQLNGALRNNSMLVITLLSSCTKLILPQSSNDTELYKQSPLVNYRTKTENNLHYSTLVKRCFQFSGLLNVIIKSRQQQKQKSKYPHITGKSDLTEI